MRPAIPETPVPEVPLEDLRRLLKACEGRDFIAYAMPPVLTAPNPQL